MLKQILSDGLNILCKGLTVFMMSERRHADKS